MPRLLGVDIPNDKKVYIRCSICTGLDLRSLGICA